MKQFILSLALLYSLSVTAQVTRVYFQASGLTCSMCSNAINKSLRTLDFIDKIHADVKKSTFELSFKTGRDVDFDRIRMKVEDAGFSISEFHATVQFDNVQLVENQEIKVGTLRLSFVNQSQSSLNGETKIQVLDRGFLSSKEYKRVSISQPTEGVYHVTL